MSLFSPGISYNPTCAGIIPNAHIKDLLFILQREKSKTLQNHILEVVRVGSWMSGHLGGSQPFGKIIMYHGLVLWEQRGEKGGVEPQFLMQLTLNSKKPQINS